MLWNASWIGFWMGERMRGRESRKGLLTRPQLVPNGSALIHDIDWRGLADSTIVFCAGEFGRMPQINSGAGRDHWSHAMAVFLAGGGFRRGVA
jgi:uncharacterized protein (DUF1501 family)